MHVCIYVYVCIYDIFVYTVLQPLPSFHRNFLPVNTETENSIILHNKILPLMAINDCSMMSN